MNSNIESPTATYRFQLRQKTHTDPGVTFANVEQQIPYLKKLGISHVYFSPIITPVKGSEHCYDGVNYDEINPDIGGEKGFEHAVKALHKSGIKVIVDFVPNHMGTGTKNGQNRWWQDLLLNGKDSKYARYFDVFWDQHQKNGPIVMAELGEPFENLIKTYNRDPDSGNYTDKGDKEDRDPACRIIIKDNKYFFDAWNDLFPINKAGTKRLQKAGTLKAINHNPELLEEVHDLQHYRLEYWLTGENKLNYRRFFAYRELAGLRIEDPQVFDDVHAGLAKWKDMIDGVRVDHIDGLRDPTAYLEKLRHLLGQDKYIVAEDILSAKEALPSAWLQRIQGTTGYDHLIAANRLFTKPSRELTQAYESFTGKKVPSYEEVQRQSRLAFVEVEMKPELQRLQNGLEEIAALAGKHFKKDDLRTALKEVTAAFPVYRTYVTTDTVSQDDRDVIAKAVTRAKTHAGRVAPEIDFIADVLSQNIPSAAKQTRDFTMTYQQFSSPVVAKGTEDTAFYRYNLLRGAAEVGAELDQLGLKPAEFTEYLTTRMATTMNASSTHDTKLGEDTRARALALSYIPKIWGNKANQWKKHLADAQVAGEVTPENQYLFLQTLVASFPLELLFDDTVKRNSSEKRAKEWMDYEGRIKGFMKKALREEKVNTGYSDKHGDDYAANNHSYEFGVDLFINRVLHDESFMKDFKPFARKVALMGANVSLAQRILQTTAPGVPDIYQGNEGWNLSLVDPDNRRTPDFARLEKNLNRADNMGWEQLSDQWHDGMVKQVLTQKLLHLRQDNKDLFGSNAPGELVPLEVHRPDGSAVKDMVAFARVHEGKTIVVAVPVALNDDVYKQEGTALGLHSSRFKDDIEITLPEALQDKQFVDALCDNHAVTVANGSLKLSKAFQHLPGVVLGSGLSTGVGR